MIAQSAPAIPGGFWERDAIRRKAGEPEQMARQLAFIEFLYWFFVFRFVLPTLLGLCIGEAIWPLE